ncbi:hypothetical protein [Rhizobium sp.]|uniref:hypothetical protein n=1 Tax=Rhizobium sp. TaxID=391 RepID=UPI00289BB9FA
MSKSSWGVIVAVGLMIFTGFASAQEPVNPALENDPVTKHRQEKSATESNGPANCQDQNIISLDTPVGRFEALSCDDNPKGDQIRDDGGKEREIRDLQAQEDMALWAKLMFWSTLVSIAVGFIGLFFVYKTLKATRDISVKQLRAYISVEVENMGDISKRNFSAASARVSIVNKGQTPARVIRHLAVIGVFEVAENVTADLHSYRQNFIDSSATIGPGESMAIDVGLLDISERLHTKAAKSKNFHYVAIGEVIYQDVFEKEHITEFCLGYEVIRAERPDAPAHPFGLATYVDDIRTYDWIRFGKHNKAD